MKGGREGIIQMKKEGIKNVNPENQSIDEPTRMNDGWNVDEDEGQVGDQDSLVWILPDQAGWCLGRR